LQIPAEQLAGCIDHTLLSATATTEQIEDLCRDAEKYKFHSVCVLPRWVGFASDQLVGTGVKVDGVVSFPHGAETTKIKTAQANDLIFAGADEIDMVADLSAINELDQRYLSAQLQAVLKICRSVRPAVPLKVIIETAVFDQQKKEFAIKTAADVGVDFIKTSTGLQPAGGATIEDVMLIKQLAPNCKVKAAGGIKTAKQALDMLKAGADRIGTSSGVEIIKQFQTEQL
jgi:deoxyribose-phosphate aldolase